MSPPLSDAPLLRACRGLPAERVPVWFMRQAGRSLPEYRALRGSGSILDAIKDPDLATEITLQPVRRYGVDAAILYSDIVVPAEAIGHWLEAVLQSPALFLLGVNAALFVIGMFIETSAAIIVLAPILAPVAAHFGIDPVHFGMIMVVNLALGMITPPFGVNLFAACTVARISLDRIIGHLLPFVLVILVCLMVITYVPGISLGLRDLVYAR